MNKIILCFGLIALALVRAEPPSNYGAPQEYSAPSYTYSSSSGYDSGDDGSQYVDDNLLARIAQILEQSDSSSSSGGYQSEYGPPASRSSGIQLGRPEVAQLVASFDLDSGSQQQRGYSGGYN